MAMLFPGAFWLLGSRFAFLGMEPSSDPGNGHVSSQHSKLLDLLLASFRGAGQKQVLTVTKKAPYIKSVYGIKYRYSEPRSTNTQCCSLVS